MHLREYQRQALEHISQRSTIVVLPTGAGKTLIAAKAAHTNFTTTRKPTLFLVPTKLLVDQQAGALAAETPLRVARFHGELAVPVFRDFDALVATPGAFLGQQQYDDLSLQKFGLVVFDEVHHVVKNHPYRKVALALQKLLEGLMPKVLGLTASLTYAIGKEGIKKDVLNLCAELCLSHQCLYTASDEQLLADGYKANTATAQLSSPNHATPTTTPTPASACASTAASSATLPRERKDGSVVVLGTDDLIIETQPHLLIPVMLGHIKSRITPPLHPLTLQLFDTIERYEKLAKSADSAFKSPIWEGKKGKSLRLKEWGEYAVKKQSKGGGVKTKKRKADACMDSETEGTGKKTALELLEHLYEAARLVVASQQGALELGMMYLNMTGVLKEGERVGGALGALVQQWTQVRSKLRRAQDLQEELLKLSAKRGADLRCVIFVQQRLTTHILEHFLNTNSSTTIRGLKTASIYATTSPASSKLRVTKSQAEDRVRAFANGKVTVLLATSVAEEGMDVPAANCVVRFDEVQTPVSLVQSRGRARQQDSSFLLMKENSKRPLSKLEDAEQEQRSIVAQIARDGLPVGSVSQDKKRMHAQAARFANPNAKELLKRFSADKEACRKKAKGMLNGYAQKVKADVAEGACKKLSDGSQEAVLVLSWFGGAPVRGSGKAPGKKAALNAAAFHILTQISS